MVTKQVDFIKIQYYTITELKLHFHLQKNNDRATPLSHNSFRVV